MSEPVVPEWASFFSPERFQIFIERVERQLGLLDRSFALNPQEGTCRLADKQSGSIYGIVNLAQVCNQVPMDDWDSVIESFIQQLTSEHTVDEVPADFEAARPLLRVRLFASETVETAMLLTQPIAEGFVTCLAVDLPDKVLTVSPEQANGYGVPIDYLFEIGLRNVVEKSQAERREFPVTPGVVVTSFSGDDYFIASLALALDDLQGTEPELGRLVAVPNRHQALSAPIDTSDSLGALGLLVQAARGMFRDGPGSISPYVYWVRAGKWERLDIELTEEGVGVEGPEVFIESVLRRLLE